MLHLVLKDKTGKSDTASAGADSIAMPAGSRKPCSLGKGAPDSAERFLCTRGSRPEEVWWEAVGGPAVCHFPGLNPEEKAISPNISGEAIKLPGHKECLERLGWRRESGGIKEAKRKSSL